MKALVTGGAGFIGSHIAEALCARGVKVVVLDNLSLGSRTNLDWAKKNHSLEFVEGDIRDELLVRRLVSSCDWVFHKAALPSVPYSIDHPVETDAINSSATLKLLIASRDAGVKRLFFASSSAVYGDSKTLPKHEDDTIAPLSPYGLQKYAGERYCQLATQHYGLSTVVFRYFNVFGPRQRHDSPYSGVIAKFCAAAFDDEPPLIFGDGLQSRDFVFVENVVNANLWAAEAPEDMVSGKVFNVGSGCSTTLLQLVHEIGLITGRKLSTRHEPFRAGDIRHSVADITRAQKAFGYEPRIDLREGLRQTISAVCRA